MTDEEPKRAKLAECGDVAPQEDSGTQFVDVPKVNKMVGNAPAKNEMLGPEKLQEPR